MTPHFDLERLIAFIPNMVVALFLFVAASTFLIMQWLEEYREKKQWRREVKDAVEKREADKKRQEEERLYHTKRSYELGYKGLHRREWLDAKTDKEKDEVIRKYYCDAAVEQRRERMRTKDDLGEIK